MKNFEEFKLTIQNRPTAMQICINGQRKSPFDHHTPNPGMD
jgi:hypothetical protein